MLKRWIAALALLLAVAMPAHAIDVAPGGGSAGTGGGGGAANGTGTTSGTSTTGFGKGWYPSNFVPNGTLVFIFDNTNTAVAFNRTVGCGNCLTVSTSSDGGVTYSSFNTTFVAGNEVGTMVKIPSSPPRYLGYVANGGTSHIFSSTALLSGWLDSAYAGTQLANSAFTFASNTNGSVVLSSAGTAGAVEVCKSLNQGVSFGSCVTFGTSNPNSSQSLAFAGGTTWLAVDNGNQLFRSTNDGGSFSLITTFTAGGGGGANVICLSPNYTTCVANASGNILVSHDAGLTWLSVLGIAQTPALCDYGSGNVGIFGNTPPVGLSAITQNAWSSNNNGDAFYSGNVYGSTSAGVGAPTVSGIACNSSGRGVAAIHSTAGTPNFAFYNPLTSPGGTLTSSAGGYNVSALIQGGIILNAAPTTSAANTAATITLTNTAGSRICIREVVVFSSAAGTPTLVLQENAVTFVNYGTLTSGTAPTRFSGSPLFCGNTGLNVQVVIGAAGVGITTTTSVVADRYPQ